MRRTAAEPRPEVLVVDDERDICFLVRRILADEGYDVASAEGFREALRVASTRRFAALLLDLRLRDGDGLDLLQSLRAAGVRAPAIVVTAFADLEAARRAIRLGAADLISKPFRTDELKAAVRRCAPSRRQSDAPSPGDLMSAMGQSSAVLALDEEVSQVAATDLSVVLTGETGTGKELVARAIHARSARRLGPLVALDCGAVSETLAESDLFGHERGAFTGAERRHAGRFERASGGTLLLDEVENLARPAQARLLRVLEERTVERLGGESPLRVDFRLVAATNDPLEASVADGAFRLDLFHRLAEVTIALPPLRDRPEDIVYLAVRFLAEARRELGKDVVLSDEALAALEAHDWPGNVRELRNVVRRAVLRARGAEVRAQDLDSRPPARTIRPVVPGSTALVVAARARVVSLPAGGTLRDIVKRTVASTEKAAILEALARCHGNKSEAARRLGCDCKTLFTKCRAYAIATKPEPPDGRGPLLRRPDDGGRDENGGEP